MSGICSSVDSVVKGHILFVVSGYVIYILTELYHTNRVFELLLRKKIPFHSHPLIALEAPKHSRKYGNVEHNGTSSITNCTDCNDA